MSRLGRGREPWAFELVRQSEDEEGEPLFMYEIRAMGRTMDLEGLIVIGATPGTKIMELVVGIQHVIPNPLPAKLFEVGLSFKEIMSIETDDTVLRSYQQLRPIAITPGHIVRATVKGEVEDLAIWGMSPSKERL